MNARRAAERARQGFGPVVTDPRILAAVASIVFDNDEDPGIRNRGLRKTVSSSTTRHQSGGQGEGT